MEKATKDMERRHFLALLSRGALGAAGLGELLTLAGCGSGGGASTPPPSGIQPVVGTVNTSQIGGSGLSVFSAMQAPTAVSASGTFETTTGAVAPQLLGVVDSAGEIRALALGVPGGVTRATDAGAPIDAASTAAALVFMTPGILSTDASEAQTRLAQIQTLSTFPALVNHLSSQLPSQPIRLFRRSAATEGFVGTCIRQWFSAHNSRAPRSRSATTTGFTVEDEGGPRSADQLKLTNYAWRYIAVTREAVDAGGNELSIRSVYRAMPGAIPVSWGSLLAGIVSSQSAAGAPSVAMETVDLTTSGNLNALRYWVRGPGTDAGSDPIPPSLTDSDNLAWGASIVFYVLFPLIDMGLGIGGRLTHALDKVSDVWALIQAAVGGFQLFVQDLASGDAAGAASELVNLIQTAWSLVGKDILMELGENSVLASITGPLLEIISVGMGAANIDQVVADWTSYAHDSYSQFGVALYGGLGGVIE